MKMRTPIGRVIEIEITGTPPPCKQSDDTLKPNLNKRRRNEVTFFDKYTDKKADLKAEKGGSCTFIVFNQ